LTDDHADPPGLTEAFYTERLIRLPRAFFCFQPFQAPPVTPLPALASGRITFGSFNNTIKVTPETIDAWLRILQRVEGSRMLVLGQRDGDFQRRLYARAAESGVAAERIEVREKRPRQDYLRMVAEVDVALDTFPFTGHTTTCDLIWMG